MVRDLITPALVSVMAFIAFSCVFAVGVLHINAAAAGLLPG